MYFYKRADTPRKRIQKPCACRCGQITTKDGSPYVVTLEEWEWMPCPKKTRTVIRPGQLVK